MSLVHGFGVSRRGVSCRRKQACHEAVRRALEVLESRLLLAVTPSLDGLRATFTGDGADNALFLRASVSDGTLEFSTDGVSYSADLDAVEPEVQSLSSGALASLTVTMGTGSDTLTIDATLHTAISANGGTLTFTGGGGSDQLVGPAADNSWRLTGADAGSLNGWIEFTGVARLTGSAAGNDVFVLEPAASSSGMLDGGAGGADEILPSSGSTDVIGYTTGGSPGEGTVQRNSTTIASYTGVELTGTGTGSAETRRFEGTIYADQVRVYRPEAGKIAIESDSNDPAVGLQTIIFDDPTSALVIELGRNAAGTDEHVYIESLGDFGADIYINTQVGFGDGPASVKVQGDLNLLGHKFEVQTGRFTLESGVDLVTSLAGGVAGDIHVLANHISIEDGASLLAEGATDGAILLQAENTNTYFTPLINIDITDTDVTIGNATIRGGFVSITSLSDTQHILDLNDSESGQFNNGFPTGTTFGSLFGTILDGVLGALELGVFAGVAVGKSTASIDVAHLATISATSDLVIHASGLARACTAPVLQKAGGIAVGVAITDAQVNLDGTISSGGDMTIRASADHRVDVMTDTAGAKKIAGAVAVSVIDSNAVAHVKEGASLIVGGDLSVQADTIDRNRTLSRSTSGTDGDIAIAAAVSVEHGDTQALMDGNADVAGGVSVNAQQSKELNTANKIFVIPGWASGVAAVAGAGINTTGDFLDDTKSALIGYAITFLKGLFTSEQSKWVNGTIAKDNISTLDLAGAFAVVVDTNNVTARIGDGAGNRADVEADGSVEVTASIDNRPDVTASASAIAPDPNAPPAPGAGTQSTRFGGSAAITVGTYHNNANAYIAEDADVDAMQGVTVAAHTRNQIDPMGLWGANLVAPFFASADFKSDQGVQTIHNGDIVEVAGGHTGGGDEGSWYKYVGGGSNSIDLGTADFADANVWFSMGSPVANTGMNIVRTITTYLNDNLGLDNNLVDNWTQAVAQGQEISIAGAISILNLDHTATAEVKGGARINQDINGNDDTGNFRTGDQDVVVSAGSVNMLVALGGNFQTPGLTGDTNKFTVNPQAPGAGSNAEDGKGAVGATAMLFDEDNTVTARIDDGAVVYADSLKVAADTFVVHAALGASGGDASNFGFNGAFIITLLDNATLAQVQNGATVVVGNGSVKDESSADFSSDQGFENVSSGNIVEVRTRDANGLIIERHWYKYLGEAGRIDLSSQDYSNAALWQDLGTNGANLGASERGVSVLVEARDRSYVVNVTGGVCVSDHIGVGASAGVNIINRNTQAVIGNLFDDLSGDASQDFVAGGNVEIHAVNAGFIGSFSVAGSVSSQNSDSSPQGSSGMSTSGGSSTSNPMDLAAGPIIGQHRGMAGDTSSNPADGGAGTNTGQAGISISGAVALNIVDDNASAYVRNSGDVAISGGSLRLVSENKTSVGSLAGAVALSLGGGTNQTTQVAVAGAVGLNFMDGTTDAYLDGASSLSSDGFDAQARRSGYVVSLTAGVAGAVGRSGYAVAGSVGVTRTTYNTEAALRNTSGTVSGAVNLRAEDDTNIVLVNGAGGFGGKVGIGAAVSFTEIQNTTVASIEHVKGDATSGRPDFKYTGGLSVEAVTDGDIIAVTASAGVGTGQGGVGVGASGTVSVNIIDNTVEAKIADTEATADSGGSVLVRAEDNSFIFSFAGAFGAGKTAGFGAALASNFLTNAVAASVDDSKLRATGTFEVLAEQRGGLVAVGVGGAGGKVAVAGGIAVNQTTDQTSALILNGSEVVASGAVTVSAHDRSTIVGIAGGGAGGSQVAIGASVSVNLLANALTANIDDAQVQSTGSTLEVRASADTVLVDVGVAGAGAGTFAGGASVAVNQLGNTLTASITDSNGDAPGVATNVQASGNLHVRASDNTTVVVVAGSGAGAGTAAVGAAAATVQVSNIITAYVNGAVVRSTGGAVEVAAGFAPPATDADLQSLAVGTDDVLLPETDGSQIVNITVGAAGAGTVAGGAAISLTWLRNNVQAYISGGSDVDAYGDVTVAAADSPEIDSSATAGAGSGEVAAAFAISYNYIGGDPGDPARDIPADPASTNVGQARAYIDASQVDSSAGSIHVLADTQPRIINATVAGAGAGTVGGSGAVSVNFIRSIVDASITNSRGTDAAGLALRASANDSVNVQATTTPLMVIIAGNGSGGGAAGIGAASATNDSRSDITARIEGSAVTATTGNVLVDAQVKAPSTLPDIGPVDATFDAQIWAFAVSGAGAGGASVAGSLSLNWIRNTIDAHISSSSIVHADSSIGAVTVSSADHSTINSIAGTGSGSGGFAVGASVANNYIGGDPNDPASLTRNTIEAYIEDSTVTAHAVTVDAFSDSNINNLCFAGSGAGTFALGGSVSLNFIRKTVDAHISGGATSVTTSGSSGDVNVSADDSSTINVLSMQGAGAGFVAGGAALAYNDISNTIEAYTDHSTIVATLGSVNFHAVSDADITSVAAGVGGAGAVAVSGSAAANLIANSTLAHITAASVTANDNVTVIADADNRITTVGGTLAISGVVGIGGSVVFSKTSNVTKAYLDSDSIVIARGVSDGASVPTWGTDTTGSESTETVRGLSVIATTTETIAPTAATAGVALPSGGGNVGIGANVMTTLVGDITEAYVDDSSVNSSTNPGQRVVIRAHQDTDLTSSGGTLGVGDVGLGADVHVDVLSNTTKAYISDSDPGTGPADRTAVYGSAGVEVNSLTREHVQEVAVGAGIGTWVGAAGAAAAIKTTSTTEAFIREAGVSASAGNIDVLANSGTSFEVYTGALGASLAVGAGLSVAVGMISNTTTAHLDGATTDSFGTTTVKATSDEDVASAVATAGVGSYGVAGSIAVISTNSTTRATLGQGTAARNSLVDSSAGSVVVEADNTTRINDGLGSAALSLNGSLGAGADVIRVANTVEAAIAADAIVTAVQDVNVQATSSRDVDSVVVAFGISTGIGVAGAVSVISIGTGLTSDGAEQVSGITDDVNGVIAPSGGFGGINNDPNDSDQTSDIIASSIAGNTFTISADADSTLWGTDAYIGQGAHVTTTSGNINVAAHETVTISDSNGGEGQLVGSGAIGVFGVSVGGSVAITTVSGSAHAYIDKLAVISAGSTIAVDSVYDTDLSARAYGGSAGLVGLGAQVAVIDDHSSSIAEISDGTSGADAVYIIDAGALSITAGGTHSLASEAKGASGGGLAAGVAVAKAHIDGSTAAHLGDYAQVGQDADPVNAVGDILVSASSSNSASADEKAVSVGVLADGNGNISEATITPAIEASVGSSAAINTTDGDVTVEATSSGDGASAVSKGVGGSLVAHVGVSYATASFSPSVTASLESNGSIVAEGGAVTVRTVHNQDGSTAYAEAGASGGGALAGNGAVGTATANADVDSYIGSYSTVTAGQGVSVAASSSNSARAKGGQVSAGLVAVGAAKADAYAQGSTLAHVDDHATIGSEGEPVESLTISAAASDVALAQTTAASGGVVDVDADMGAVSGATVSATVSGYVGDSATINVAGDVSISASQQTDSDASANGTNPISGVKVGGSKATTRLTPTISAYVGAYASISAGGSVNVAATHGVPADVPDGSFDPATDVDSVTDTITFASPHGLIAGDTVTYLNLGAAEVVGGLESGRSYTVLDAPTSSSLILGNSFDSDSVSLLNDTITFSRVHGLQDNDQLIYDAPGGTAIGNLTAGTIYYVRVIDAQTIKLSSTPVTPTTNFSAADVDSASNRINLAGFMAGQAVTYRAAPPYVFPTSSVEGPADAVEWTGHGLTTGTEVIYNAWGTAIGGLEDGGRYFAVVVDEDHTALARTYADATAVDVDGYPAPILIDIDPDVSDENSQHVFTCSIAGLNTGQTYYVINADAASFQLSATEGGEAIDIDATNIPGTQTIGVEGIDFLALGSGTQTLRVDLTAATVAGAKNQLSGAGGALLLVAEPTGDGIANAYAHGSAGSVLGNGVHQETSATASVTTSARVGIGATIVSGMDSAADNKDITVTSSSVANSSATSSNSASAGFGSNGSATATARQTSTNSADIGDGASISSGGNFILIAATSTWGDTHADSTGGSAIKFASATATTAATYTNRANVGASSTIAAAGDVTVNALVSNVYGHSYTYADAKGLGGDASSSNTVSLGTATIPALSQTSIAPGARIEAANVDLLATLTKIRLDDYAKSYAAALGADSDARSHANLYATTDVSLADSVTVLGAGHINLKSVQLDVGNRSHSNAICHAFAGDTDSNAYGETHPSATVNAAAGATLYTRDLQVQSRVNLTDDSRDHDRNGAFIDPGDSHAHGATSTTRLINFNADVVFLAASSPRLVVDVDGNVITADNLTIEDTDDTSGVGPVAASQIVVNDIINTTGGTAYFEALGSNSDGNVARISGTQSTFTFEDAFERVELINHSSKDLVIGNIGAISSAHPTVQIYVASVPQTGDSAFLFDVVRDAVGTIVSIENTLAGAAGSPDIIFRGLVNNPVGATRVRNAGGDIISYDAAGVIRTNVADIAAEQGDIGDAANAVSRLGIELVQSAGLPATLQAVAAGASSDVYLRLTGVLRDAGESSFTGNVTSIQAGHDVDLLLADALEQPNLDLGSGYVRVTVPFELYTRHIYTHFRPDPAGAAALNLGAFADASAAASSPIASTWSFGSATLAGLIAGNNINVQQSPSPAATLAVAGYTDTTGEPAAGWVDVTVNGSITLSETSGDMRVGNIVSTADDVTLTAPGSIIDAASDSAADVTGRNIALAAGTPAVSGTGSIGSETDFLEIDSSYGAPGLLTASAPDDTYLYETDGDMNVAVVQSDLADVWLIAEDSILDGDDDPAADVVGNNIHLQAGTNGGDGDDGTGSIGADANDLEIDSSFANPAGNGVLLASAKQHLYLTESTESLNVSQADADTGNIRLTIPDTADFSNEDLNVIADGIVEAGQSVLLRAGDDVAMAATSRITAGTSLTIYGDWLSADTGVGTTMSLRGTLEGHPILIFGNADNDVVLFDQTLVNGPARVYGSNNAQTIGDDGQDQFIVTRLRSMTTYTAGTRDSLNLDGQGQADTYTIDTSNELRDYVVNVLDTGSPADVDAITVNGTAGADVFDVSSLSVARSAQFVGYSGVEVLSMLLLDGDDVCNVTPSATTTYFLDGGAHPAGDTLNFDAEGATIANDGLTITGDTFLPISYTRFEILNYFDAIASAPTAVDLGDSSDTGSSNTDNLTKLDNNGSSQVLSFLVMGTIAGSTVTLYADGVAIGSAVATSTSTWVQTGGTYDLLDGSHGVTARQGATGLTQSAGSPGLSVTVDTIAPSILSWASAAVHGMGVGEVGLVIANNGKFTEPRTSGISRLLLTPSEAIDPATWFAESVGLWGNGAAGALDLSNIAITTAARDSGVLTIGFSPQLPDVAKYRVRVLGLRDLAGNSLSGLSGDNERIMSALRGDATGDGRVNNTDVGAAQTYLNVYPVNPSVINQVRSDVTCDGRINNTDIGAIVSVRGNYTLFIAAPSAPAGKANAPSPKSNGISAASRVAIFSNEPLIKGMDDKEVLSETIDLLLSSQHRQLL